MHIINTVQFTTVHKLFCPVLSCSIDVSLCSVSVSASVSVNDVNARSRRHRVVSLQGMQHTVNILLVVNLSYLFSSLCALYLSARSVRSVLHSPLVRREPKAISSVISVSSHRVSCLQAQHQRHMITCARVPFCSGLLVSSTNQRTHAASSSGSASASASGSRLRLSFAVVIHGRCMRLVSDQSINQSINCSIDRSIALSRIGLCDAVAYSYWFTVSHSLISNQLGYRNVCVRVGAIDSISGLTSAHRSSFHFIHLSLAPNRPAPRRVFVCEPPCQCVAISHSIRTVRVPLRL